MHEAQTTFCELIRAVQVGAEVVVEDRGKPVAKMIAYRSASSPRPAPGMFKGQIAIKPGFDDIPDGFAESFE
jgi:antitoxin (DNA-binding transcriptional repressor) of toxin-antitoxin stability system